MSRSVAVSELASYFDGDETAAAALLNWAEGMGGWIRLPSQRWRAGGYSGSLLRMIVLHKPGPSGRPDTEKIVVKLLPEGPYANETGLHERAWAQSEQFAEQHLVRQVYRRYPVGDGRYLMFQKPAGSLLESRTLGDLPVEHRAAACGHLVRLLLTNWNTVDRPQVGGPVSAAEYLRNEVRGALDEGRSAYRWATAAQLFDGDSDWITTAEDGDDHPLVNPVRMIGRNSLVRGVPIDYITGCTHGDAHLDNALVPYRSGRPPELDKLRLVDLAGFDPDAPISRDVVALVLSAVSQTVSKEPTEVAAKALIEYILDPRDDPPLLLTKATTDVIRKIYEPSSEVTTDWHDEWRVQYRLSLLAQALVYTSFDSIGPHGQWWYFRLAAHAGTSVLRDLLPGAPAPTEPGRVHRPTADTDSIPPSTASTARCDGLGSESNTSAIDEVVAPETGAASDSKDDAATHCGESAPRLAPRVAKARNMFHGNNITIGGDFVVDGRK